MALRAAATTSAGAVKRVLVPIADGSEEIETSCITDTLVRAGAEVTVASVEATTTCTMSRGLKIVADALVTDVSGEDWDLVALPGGMPGAERLRDSDALARDPAEAGRAAGAFGGGLRVPAVILKSKGDRRKPSDHVTRRRPSWRRRGTSQMAPSCATATLQRAGPRHVPQIRPRSRRPSAGPRRPRSAGADGID